jgi:FkbM family methyltransferase
MPQTRTLTTSLGHVMTVFKDDYIGDKILKQGLYERENLALLLDLLGKIEHPVVLDIGANIGNHALAFSTRAREVHAFEPVPAINALLSENVRRNGLGNVTVHPVALSDASGSATLHVNTAGNLGASSFDSRGGSEAAIEVAKATGDEFLAAAGVGRVDLVKIDVEAHEAFVLRGLCKTLARDLPWLTLEWNDPLTIQRLHGSEELGFLLDHYTPWVLGSNHDRLFWKSRPFGLLRRKWHRLFTERRALLYPFEPTRLYKNLLFVPKGREALLDPRHFLL